MSEQEKFKKEEEKIKAHKQNEDVSILVNHSFNVL